tara:strand:+ start:18954 stop:19385 length:432 start_codon:yes stop_codon:yes gene_type:complete
MIEKDIKRLQFTFSKGHIPNDNDFDALDSIIKYVNKEKQRELNNYHLFARMYVSQFKNVLIKSGGNYQLASKSILDIVQMNLNDQLDRLILEANQIYLEKDIKEKGVDSDFNISKYDKEKMKDKIIQLINNLIEDYGTNGSNE